MTIPTLRFRFQPNTPRLRARVLPAIPPLQPQFRNNGTHIQWRVGTNDWADLVALTEIEGPIASIVAGDGIDIDATDPVNPTVAVSDTLTNKTLVQPTLTLKQGASEAPTAEGDARWDSDDDVLVIGNGSTTKRFYPQESGTYVPTWSSSGDQPDIGDGTIDGNYMRQGFDLSFGVEITFGSTTDPGTGDYRVSPPVSITKLMSSQCVVRDASLDERYIGVLERLTGATLFAMLGSGSAVVNYLGASTPITWADEDYIRIGGIAII